MQKKIIIVKKSYTQLPDQYSRYIPILKVLTFIFFFFFIIYAGKDFFHGIFNSLSRASEYFLIGFQTLISLTVIVICYSKLNTYKGTFLDFLRKFNKPFLGFLILFILFFLIQGNRGPALQLILIIAGFYSLYVKPIKLRYFLVFLIAGMFIMTFISNARVTRTSGYTKKSAFTDYFERGANKMRIASFIDIGQELIGAYRNLYFDVNYAEAHGFNYGKTMLSPVTSVIPGFGSFTVSLFNLDPNKLTSSKLISSMILGENATWGIGANFIGDIYMSFGAIGVILFMIFFGYINTKFQIKAIFSKNIYYIIAYLISISYSTYYSRAAYFTAFRDIIWPIIILFILREFVFKKQRFIRPLQKQYYTLKEEVK